MGANNPFPFTVQQVMIGAEATVGTEASANDFKTTNVHPFDFSGLEAVALDNRRAHMRGTALKPTVGARTGRITLSQDFHGWLASDPSAAPTVSDAVATPGSHPIMDYLGALLGNRKADGYVSGADLTGSTTSALKADDLTDFNIGFPALVATGAAAKPYEVVWLTNNTVGTPDSADLLQVMANAQTGTGQEVYGSITAYHVAAGSPFWQNDAIKAYSIGVYGADADAKWMLLGCMPVGGSLIMTEGQFPQLDMEWGVSDWTAETSGGAPADLDYNNGDVGTPGADFPDAEPFMDAWVTLSDASSASAAVQFRVQDLRIDFNVEATPIRDPGSTSGVCGYAISKRNPTVTFTVFRDHSEEVADWLAGTEKTFSFQCGSVPGRIITGLIPEAFHMAHPSVTNVDDMLGSTITLGCGPYADDTGTRVDSAPINQAFRLAVL